MPRFQLRNSDKESGEDELGGQMSFLEHLDELRKRLIRSIVFVFIAAMLCWFVSDRIYNFLARPVQRALAQAQQHRSVTIAGLNGNVSIVPLSSLHPNDKLRFVFPDPTRLGTASIPAGASVAARVDKDSQGNVGLYTDEPLYAGNEVVPKDVKLLGNLTTGYDKLPDVNDKLVLTTPLQPFPLHLTMSL